MTTIAPLAEQHISTAVTTLARAFHDDPLLVYSVPDAQKRARALPHIGAAALSTYQRTGHIDAVHAGKGFALWSPPGGSDATTWQNTTLPFRIGLGATRRLLQCLSATDKLHKAALPGPHWYLVILAIDPALQGQKLGGTLLTHGLQRADADGLPAYLETYNERTIRLYERFGFRVVADEVIAGGVRVWGLVRPSQ